MESQTLNEHGHVANCDRFVLFRSTRRKDGRTHGMYGEVHSRFEQPAESIHATLPARIALSVLYGFVSVSVSRPVDTCACTSV